MKASHAAMEQSALHDEAPADMLARAESRRLLGWKGVLYGQLEYIKAALLSNWIPKGEEGINAVYHPMTTNAPYGPRQHCHAGGPCTANHHSGSHQS